MCVRVYLCVALANAHITLRIFAIAKKKKKKNKQKKHTQNKKQKYTKHIEK